MRTLGSSGMPVLYIGCMVPKGLGRIPVKSD